MISSIPSLLPFTLVALSLPISLSNTASQFIRVRSFCSGTNFDSPSSYKTNLDTLLSSLASNASISSNNGYYATNTTTASGGTETIFSLFLCRGDIVLSGDESCQGCVAVATKDLPPKECPEDKVAAIYYDMCMVRYSNQSFLGYVDEKEFKFWKNDDFESLKVDANQFIQLAGETLNELADKTALGDPKEWGAKKYFGTKKATLNSYVSLYTMAQCTPDLRPIDCRRCLILTINEITNYCNGSKGCRILNRSCYTRYEVYPFSVDVASPVGSPTQHPPGLPPPPPPPPPIKKNMVNVVLSILVLLLVALVAVLVYLQRRRKINDNVGSTQSQNRARDAPELGSVNEGFSIMVESLQYDLATLHGATNNFSGDSKIGEGGCAIVYKGILPNGQEIAVKRLTTTDSSQSKQQFKSEVEFVAKLQHRNLVRLLGYCLTPDEKLLVYEFVPRMSLDLILFDPKMKEQLNWSTRYKIIQGIARGLLYLHEDSRLKIVHRDLKASNVLLDANMNPKISDFGLARNFHVNQEQDVTTRPAGTLAYMAPEYLEHGEFSTKSDVYSFGVLILEIISGKKHRNRQTGIAHNLLTYAWKNWKDCIPLAFVDASFGDSYSNTEVIRCMHLGLLCVQPDAEERPSMISIVSYLNSSLALPAPQQPAVLLNILPKESISETKEQASYKTSKTASSSRTSESRQDKSKSISMHSSSDIDARN